MKLPGPGTHFHYNEPKFNQNWMLFSLRNRRWSVCHAYVHSVWAESGWWEQLVLCVYFSSLTVWRLRCRISKAVAIQMVQLKMVAFGCLFSLLTIKIADWGTVPSPAGFTVRLSPSRQWLTLPNSWLNKNGAGVWIELNMLVKQAQPRLKLPS